MSYIVDADITDAVLSSFMSDTYHDLVDAFCVSVSKDKGIYYTDYIATEADGTLTNYTFKELAISYACQKIAEDKWGVNTIGSADDEKYRLKMEYYKDKTNMLYDKLTEGMIKDEETIEREPGGIGNMRLYRG